VTDIYATAAAAATRAPGDMRTVPPTVELFLATVFRSFFFIF